ncbi:unnamed protein product [Soboliphyme baturini]|uniref:RRM domain-containing protein n=1 Tax=Soboliphyme baturini TaxID=241478 RepID=A0A183J3S9_9BILA|nr:unnamed protein product [Soboliphyme baturini]
MLDMELEMINQQQVGGDTSDLQRRLTELRNEISLLTSSDGMARLDSGKGFITGVAGHLRNKKIPRSATLDKRPRDLLVSGFMFEERDLIIDHFQKFGALEDIEYLPNKEKNAVSKAIVLYRARKDAEVAFALGSDFLGRKLEIQWASSARAAQHGAVDEVSAGQEMSAEAILASLDDDLSEEENQLIDENDEEEIGEEERAWKR